MQPASCTAVRRPRSLSWPELAPSSALLASPAALLGLVSFVTVSSAALLASPARSQVPRQLKPLIERATQGAHEAEAGVLSSLVPDLAPQMEGVLPPLPGSPGGSGTMLNL